MKFKNIKYPLLLYSSNFDCEEKYLVYPNFYYLTQINQPNLIIFYIPDINTLYLSNLSLKLKVIQFLDIDKKPILKKITQEYEIENLIKEFQKRNNGNKNNIIVTLNNYSLLKLSTNIKFNTQKLEASCSKRLFKNDYEKMLIKRSCLETCKAIKKTLPLIVKKKFTITKQIVSNIKRLVKEEGIMETAYDTICSTGRNNTILHYSIYDNKLNKGDIILLDVGFRYKCYCSDITRSFPVSGKFSPEQKEIYKIVLTANKNCIKKVKHGANFNDIQDEAFFIIFDGLKKLGIIKNEIGRNISTAKKLMYHSLGHSVGIEVHDLGDISILKKDMVITIEPGIYFRDELLSDNEFNKKILEKYMIIGGIRIEDTLLVTKDGFINYSKHISKEIIGIENMMCN